VVVYKTIGAPEIAEALFQHNSRGKNIKSEINKSNPAFAGFFNSKIV
jgi:hypothetical protein